MFHRLPSQPQPNADRCSCERRAGAVSIWAIVCLVVVTGLSATLGKLAIAGSRHMIQERRRAQADWLADAGWSLATAQLTRNPAYAGETWEVAATELGGADRGRVVITVTAPPPDAAEKQQQIQIVAEFPLDSDHRVQITRNGTVNSQAP